MAADTNPQIPLSLLYAAQDSRLRAVRIPAPGAELLVAVVEPGHDPKVQWKGLREMLEAEGIL